MELSNSPNIYITAFNCSPGRGSDHASGWNHIKHISKYCKVRVITQLSYRADFIGNPEVEGNPNLEIEYVKNPVDLTFLNTLSYPWGFYLSYRFWEKAVYKHLKQKQQNGKLDLVHRLTLGAMKEPGYSWRLSVPFIWGQAHLPPKVKYRFFSLFSWSTQIVMLLSNLSRVFIALNSRCRKGMKRSALVYAVNLDGKSYIKRNFNVTPEVCYEVAVEGHQPQTINERAPNEPLQIVWVGRVVDFKGLELVLRALARLNGAINYKLTVAGDGKDVERMKRLAIALKINAEFLGLIDYSRVSALFQSSHCFIYTSFKDGLSSVIFESLSNNCPVICLDHLGYGEVINSTVGLKVAVHSIQQIVDDIAKNVERLYFHENERVALIKNIPALLANYTWDSNARKIIKGYERVLNVNLL
jgi:glycosyltransferase involved in cell wall biosynthesis